MKFSKKLIVPAATLVVLAGSGATAMAATSATGQKSLSQEIASKFGLDQSQVQSVIDQHKSERQQDRETKYEDHLNQAVTDSKLTSSQKEAVLTEHNKLVAELKASSKDDHKATLKTVRQEAKDWASQNSIDVKWALPVRGMGSADSITTN